MSVNECMPLTFFFFFFSGWLVGLGFFVVVVVFFGGVTCKLSAALRVRAVSLMDVTCVEHLTVLKMVF